MKRILGLLLVYAVLERVLIRFELLGALASGGAPALGAAAALVGFLVLRVAVWGVLPPLVAAWGVNRLTAPDLRRRALRLFQSRSGARPASDSAP
jgi:hypothetical protein